MTALVDDVSELLILLPALDDAMERDGGAAEGEPVSGGPAALRLPVNADVLGASMMLAQQVPALAVWAADVLGEPGRRRSVEGHLRHVARWHERMLVTAARADAARLVDVVADLLRRVKLALGLRLPDRRLGQFCPLHDAPLCELIKPGAVATLTWRLDPGRPGGPALVPTVEWLLRDVVVCHGCNAVWTPGDYLAVGRLMRQADIRRVTAGNAAA